MEQRKRLKSVLVNLQKTNLETLSQTSGGQKYQGKYARQKRNQSRLSQLGRQNLMSRQSDKLSDFVAKTRKQFRNTVLSRGVLANFRKIYKRRRVSDRPDNLIRSIYQQDFQRRVHPRQLVDNLESYRSHTSFYEGQQLKKRIQFKQRKLKYLDNVDQFKQVDKVHNIKDRRKYRSLDQDALKKQVKLCLKEEYIGQSGELKKLLNQQKKATVVDPKEKKEKVEDDKPKEKVEDDKPKEKVEADKEKEKKEETEKKEEEVKVEKVVADPVQEIKDEQFNSCYDRYVEDVIKLKEELEQQYPHLFEKNEDYFQTMIERIVVEPQNLLKTWKNSPLQSLRLKYHNYGHSYNEGEFKAKSPIISKGINCNYYTQKLINKQYPMKTLYSDSFCNKGQVKTELLRPKFQVEKQPFIFKSSYSNQYLNYGTPCALIVKRPHVLHVIESMPFGKNTLYMDSYTSRPIDDQDSFVNALARERFEKRTQLYMDSGSMVSETQNSRTYQGQKLGIKPYVTPKPQFISVPSYKGQFQSTSKNKHSIAQHQFKNQEKEYQRQRIEDLLKRMKIVKKQRLYRKRAQAKK